ncbi:MAG: 5-aminolevulinate synthase [Acetobacter sp.]|nr:5-aminolevulinate synthase [Acetobacter sp.]
MRPLRNARHPFYDYCTKTLAHIRQQGRYRVFTPLAREAEHFPLYDYAPKNEQDNVAPSFSPIFSKELLSEQVSSQKRDVVVWSTNDYLGMGVDPDVQEAAISAIRDHGVGSGGTRNIAGHSPLHAELEYELASLHGKEAGLLFGSGYVSNQASLQTILSSTPEKQNTPWVCFSDRLNHASMIAGIKAARGAQVVIFEHNDLADLEAKLAAAPLEAPKLIAFESVYSMEGDIADIGGICTLARRYGALTYLDEVHAVGLYGQKGGGVSQRDGVAEQVDIIEGTLAKSFGVYGGYITGAANIVDFLRSTASGFIFTTSLPPALVKAALVSVRKVRAEHWRREALFERVATFQQRLRGAGIPFTLTPSHIIPIPIGEAETCKRISHRLLEEFGHYATPINYPTVPQGSERLRITPGPFHTDAMMTAMIHALAICLRDEGLIKPYIPPHNVVR